MSCQYLHTRKKECPSSNISVQSTLQSVRKRMKMHYQPLKNDTKGNLEMPDAAFQCLPTSQLVQLNRTRRILLFLTGIQFIFSLLIIFGIIYAYLFGYVMEVEWLNPVVRFLPILFCVCYLIGSLAADQSHVKGLLIFSKFLTLNIIIAYVIVSAYMILPICLKKDPASIPGKVILVVSYQAIFCICALLPAYSIRVADRLATLVTENQFPLVK